MKAADRIAGFIHALTRRWTRLALWRFVFASLLGVAALWSAALGAWWLAGSISGLAQTFLVIVTAGATVGWLAWIGWRRQATPARVALARLVEDRYPGLEDRLATAVELVEGRAAGRHEGPLDAALLSDTAGRLEGLDLDHIIPGVVIRQARWQALAAALAVVVAGAVWYVPARQAFEAAWLYLSPGRLVLKVEPGDARVPPDTPLTIKVRSTAASGGLVPELLVRMGEATRTTRMRSDGADRFSVAFESVPASFTYQVAVAGQRSREYSVTRLEPPRVARIDLTYEYPAFTKLPPRTERDGGDIYAPEGTLVHFAVHPRTTTAPVTEAELALPGGEGVPLAAGPEGTLSGTLRLEADATYRVRLRDSDGLENAEDPEYYVRLLDDRPPDVRILRPAGDRQVTPLEEVTIEARADDDHGLEDFELVVGVRGGNERAIPLGGDGKAMSLTGRHMLFLEDLDVRPGDFVSYYARARDVGRGKRPTESRSDIYFLEVTPFVDEFALAQSQAMAAAGGNQAMDDLVRVQKDIIVGTWKLEKRATSREAGPSAQDARTLGRAQANLKQRTEMAARQLQAFGRRGRRPVVEPEDTSALDAAAQAMGRAATSLAAVRVQRALPEEMEALNHLLRAQAEVQRRQVTRQQAGAGGGGFNRAQQDLSSLFDRELQRQQQTNYETPQTAQEQRDQPQDELLERVRELARRQEALARQQDDLARQRMDEEERRRRLERLSRDQTQLQRQAEALARQLGQSERQRQAQQPPQSGQQAGQSGQRSQEPSQGGQSGQSSSGASAMRQASEDMKTAASELRREAAEAARERSARALDRLRAIERELRQAGPDERRRALGDAQLEARQLADRQRQLADRAAGAAPEEAEDERRRVAGEQRQLAERTDALKRRLQELGSRGEPTGAAERDRLAEAMREVEGQRLGQRMRDVAGELERGESRAEVGDAQRSIARDLDRVADRVAGTTGGRDREGQALAEELSRARETRERLAELERQITALREQQQSAAGEAGRAGRPGQPDPESGDAERMNALQQQYEEELRNARELDRARGNENPGSGRGMSTPEGQDMVPSAPGTEAFKQDFSTWQTLHKDVTLGLERLEAALSQQLIERASRDRLRAGAPDNTPDEYQTVVEQYFRSLAAEPR